MRWVGRMTQQSWPIIVGGCFRSGTSLVRRLLNAHPRVYCGPEVKFFRDFYGDYNNDPLSHLRFMTTARSLLPESKLLDLFGSAFVALHEQAAWLAGKARWADKAPENVLYLEDWQRILGDRWQFLHVVRNPLDTLASIKEARFPLSIPEDLEGRIATYLRYTQAGLAFARYQPERSYLLVYERLVSAPEKVVRDLMAWLGEEYHTSLLAFNDFEHCEGLEDPKIGDARGVHASSLYRWPKVLTEEEARDVWSRTSRLWNSICPDDRCYMKVASA